MNVFIKSTGDLSRTITRSAAIFITVFMISMGSAFAQGTSGLLGVIPGFPQLDTSGVVGQGCSYDAGTQTLTITSTPSLYFPDANTLNFVNNGLLTLTATIDAAGNISAGSLVVNGTTSGGLGDPLLIGSTTATYGLEDTSATPGATDRGDFIFTATGGSILTDPNWPAGASIGATLTMEGSTYAGSLDSDWICNRAKMIIGPVEPDLEVCDLVLVKTAMPDVLGPFDDNNDGDNDDSDSGTDGDGSGDSDDSDGYDDSDSGASSGMDCGCKDRVTQLTLRYNLPLAKIVEIQRRKDGNWVTLPDGVATLRTPGEEFVVNIRGGKIRFLIDGLNIQKLRTRCEYPIHAGQLIGTGELVIVSGYSKFWDNTQLCPAPGTVCGPEHEVTYTYKITNNGTEVTDIVVFDDQIGVVDGSPIASIGGGAMATLTQTVCIFDDTINKATASGTQGGNLCESNEAQETVSVLRCPPGEDTDSDSGYDWNGSGDSDDSDSDSGIKDCDLDEVCFGVGFDSDSDSGIDSNGNDDSDDSDSDSGTLDCDLDD